MTSIPGAWFGGSKATAINETDQDKETVTKLKCILCDGNGRRFVGERDPIEGSKMQSSEQCPLCHGHKYLPVDSAVGQACYAYYSYVDRERLAKEVREKQRRDRRERIVSKLTDQELDELGYTREQLVR